MFQSAPPVKGATNGSRIRSSALNVSIRAPREGGDLSFATHQRHHKSFNPRPL